MQLIRKRLKVEFWLDDQLRFLYDLKDVSDAMILICFFVVYEFISLGQDESSLDDHDHCPGDLIDSLLDMDDDSQRRQYLLEKLTNVKQDQSTTTVSRTSEEKHEND